MRSTPALGRPFWMIWSATTLSGLGTGLTYVAIPLLATTYTRDPRLIAAVSVASYLPPLVFGLHSGAVVDRSDRRQIMWGTDVIRGILVALLALLVFTGNGSIAVLALMALLLGSAEIFFENASSAIVPMLVPRDGLERANSWLLSGQTITTQFIGLPVGGLLFAVAAGLPFAVDAVTFVGSLALVLAVRGRFRVDRTQDESTTVWQDVREGTRWLWRHRLLRTLALLLAAVNGAFAMGDATLVLYSLEVLGVGQLGYALLLAMLAVGAVLGSLVAERLIRAIGPTAVIWVAVLMMTAAMAAPGFTSVVGVVAASLLAGGVSSMLWNVVTISLRQAAVPPRLLGRVTSAYRVIGLGSMPVGAAIGGAVASRFGLHAPWLTAGVLLAVVAAAALPLVRAAEVDAARATVHAQ